jgi:hypothetical protein
MVRGKKLTRAKLGEAEELKEDFDWLTEDDIVDILRGLEVIPRKRRKGSGPGGGGTITTSPSTISIPDTTTPGTTIATISVAGGTGAYTFTLTDPSGQFTIVGNQLQVAGTLTAGSYPVTIHGANSFGDNPNLTTTIYVTHIPPGYVPTYYIYGF